MQSLLNTLTLASPQLTCIWLSQLNGEKTQGRLPPHSERAPRTSLLLSNEMKKSFLFQRLKKKNGKNFSPFSNLMIPPPFFLLYLLYLHYRTSDNIKILSFFNLNLLEDLTKLYCAQTTLQQKPPLERFIPLVAHSLMLHLTIFTSFLFAILSNYVNNKYTIFSHCVYETTQLWSHPTQFFKKKTVIYFSSMSPGKAIK